MDFAQLVEETKINLDIDNADICRIMGIGAMTLENYIEGYTNPSREFVARFVSAFFASRPDWDISALYPETELLCLSPEEISLKLRENGRFFTLAADNSMSKKRIFKNDFVLVYPCEKPSSGKLVLVSVEAEAAQLRVYKELKERFALCSDDSKEYFPYDALDKTVIIFGEVRSVIASFCEP